MQNWLPPAASRASARERDRKREKFRARCASRVNIRARVVAGPLIGARMRRTGGVVSRREGGGEVYPRQGTAVRNRKYFLALTHISRDDGTAVG